MVLEIPRFCNKCGTRFTFKMEESEFRQNKGNISYICDDCLYPKLSYDYVPNAIASWGKSVNITLNMLTGRNANGTFNEYPNHETIGTKEWKHCNNCGEKFLYESEHIWELDPLYLCQNCK